MTTSPRKSIKGEMTTMLPEAPTTQLSDMPDINYVLDHDPGDVQESGWFSCWYSSSDVSPPPGRSQDVIHNVTWFQAQEYLITGAGAQNGFRPYRGGFPGFPEDIAAIRGATPDEPLRYVHKARTTSVADIWAVIDREPSEHLGSWHVAMPFEDNRWYHVTDRKNLSRIQREGLVGSQHGTNRNFDMPVDKNAVYLWPTAAGAHTYPSYQNEKWQDPVVLRASNLDYSHLAPDQEEMANYLENLGHESLDQDDEEHSAIEQWVEQWEREHGHDYLTDDSWPKSEHWYLEKYIRMLREMPPEMRIQVANDVATHGGGTVMHYGPIPPHQLEVGTPLPVANEENNYGHDRWHGSPEYEQWAQANPEPAGQAPEDEDAYDRWNETHDQGFEDWAAGQDWADPDEHDIVGSWYDDPTDDSFEQQYTWTPLTQYRQANAPGADSWAMPSNTHTHMADPTGNADGLDSTQAPGSRPRIPCYCDVGLSTPHEWTGSCEKGNRPTMRYEAAMGSNWVYIEGQVSFGRHWFQIAQEMLQNMGADEETNAYVTNMLARNALPTDMDCGVGSVRNGRVQVWASTTDRNVVWDAVKTAWDAQQSDTQGTISRISGFLRRA